MMKFVSGVSGPGRHIRIEDHPNGGILLSKLVHPETDLHIGLFFRDGKLVVNVNGAIGDSIEISLEDGKLQCHEI